MKTRSIGLSSASQTMRRFRERLCRRTRVLSRKHNSCLNTSVINRAGGASHPTFVVQATRSWMDFIAARPFIGSMRGLVAMGLVRDAVVYTILCLLQACRKRISLPSNFHFNFWNQSFTALIWINLWTYRCEKNSLPLSFSFVFQYIYFLKLGFLKIAYWSIAKYMRVIFFKYFSVFFLVLFSYTKKKIII